MRHHIGHFEQRKGNGMELVKEKRLSPPSRLLFQLADTARKTVEDVGVEVMTALKGEPRVLLPAGPAVR